MPNATKSAEELKGEMNKIYSVQGLIKNIDQEFVKTVAAKNFVVGCDFGGMKCSVTPKFSKEDGWCTSIHLKNAKTMPEDQVLTITAFTGETAGIDIRKLGTPDSLNIEDFGFKVFLKPPMNHDEDDDDEKMMNNMMGKNIGDFMSGVFLCLIIMCTLKENG